MTECCNKDCDQGRKCPVRTACQLPDQSAWSFDDGEYDPGPMTPLVKGMLVALVVLVTIVVLGLMFPEALP